MKIYEARLIKKLYTEKQVAFLVYSKRYELRIEEEYIKLYRKENTAIDSCSYTENYNWLVEIIQESILDDFLKTLIFKIKDAARGRENKEILYKKINNILNEVRKC